MHLWCRRRDSNSHSFRHYPLKIACLPISPRRRFCYCGWHEGPCDYLLSGNASSLPPNYLSIKVDNTRLNRLISPEWLQHPKPAQQARMERLRRAREWPASRLGAPARWFLPWGANCRNTPMPGLHRKTRWPMQRCCATRNSHCPRHQKDCRNRHCQMRRPYQHPCRVA